MLKTNKLIFLYYKVNTIENNLVSEKFIFLKLFFNRSHFLVYLPLIAYQGYRTMNTSQFNFVDLLTWYLISLIIFFVLPNVLIVQYVKKLINKKFTELNIKCYKCNNIADIKFEGTSKLFMIPLCKEHKSSHVLENLKKEYNKYNEIILLISFSVLLMGTILLAITIVFNGMIEYNFELGVAQITAIFVPLFFIQIFTHIYFTFKMIKKK